MPVCICTNSYSYTIYQEMPVCICINTGLKSIFQEMSVDISLIHKVNKYLCISINSNLK